MKIYEALREDHDKQRELIAKLVETHGDSDERDTLFKALKSELEAHAIAEERAFYVPLMEDDLSQEKARHSVAEHHEMDEMIEKLEDTDYSSPAWLAAAKELCERVTHHLDEEEQEVFPVAGKVISDEQATALAAEYKRERDDHKD